MKKIFTSFAVLTLIGFSFCAFAQTNSQENFQNEHQRFLAKQKTIFLDAFSEIFVLQETIWQRPYGEKEYYLAPVRKDIPSYNKRIKALDNLEEGVVKSKFHCIKVEINSNSRLLLKSMNINVPDYIQNKVIVYLPEIDLDRLSQNNVSFLYLTDYGKQKCTLSKPKDSNATIWSEGFETNSVPQAGVYETLNDVDGTVVDCGWGDESCSSISGSWSAYCAQNGGACNSNCSDSYVNNMETYFWRTNPIVTNNYSDMMFSFWMKFDFNDISSTADVLDLSFDIGSGFVINGSFNSASANDELGWNYYYVNMTGAIPSFNFEYCFYSSGSWTASGVYVDDLNLSGTLASIATNDISDKVSVFPNPVNDNLNIVTDINIKSVSISDITGRQLLFSNKTNINCSDLTNGYYILKVESDNGTAIKSFIKE